MQCQKAICRAADLMTTHRLPGARCRAGGTKLRQAPARTSCRAQAAACRSMQGSPYLSKGHKLARIARDAISQHLSEPELHGSEAALSPEEQSAGDKAHSAALDQS